MEPKSDNEFGVLAGENLPNHTTSLQGLGRFVRVAIGNPTVRTRQGAYRLAAHILAKAQTLPHETEEGEEIPHGWEEVLDAILGVENVDLDADLGTETEK